jgi:hypothetical protein
MKMEMEMYNETVQQKMSMSIEMEMRI